MSRVLPMLATAGQPPADNQLWAREMKWDGMRGIAVVTGAGARLYSRTGNEVTRSYPEVAASLHALADGQDILLDGELICPDPASGVPSFTRLQRRMHVTRPTAALMRDYPAQMVAFDVLEARNRSVMDLPYVKRREVLDDLMLVGPSVLTPPYWTVDGDTILEISRGHGLEGVVSKRLDSKYQPGKRSRLWVKSVHRKTAEVVVAGWIPSTGGPRGSIGALILGAYDQAFGFVHIGQVGTGFTSAMRRTLRTQLDELAQGHSPFDHPPGHHRRVRYVAPQLIGTVHYREFSGTSLRHPSWRGLRTDIGDVRQVGIPPV